MANNAPSFISQLCFGSIEEEQILPYPKMKDTDQEVFKSIRGSIEQLLKPHEKDFREWDAKGEMPASMLEEMKQFVDGLKADKPEGRRQISNAKGLLGRYEDLVAIACRSA